MRILILIPNIPEQLDEVKGGIYSASINLLEGLSKTSHTVRLVTFKKGLKKAVYKKYSERIDIHYIPEGFFPWHALNFLFICPWAVRREVREFKPDIVHYQLGGTFLMTSILGLGGAKSVLTAHGLALAEMVTTRNLRKKITFFYNGVLERIFCPDYIIHLSNFSVELFNKYPGGKQNYTLIPNAIPEGFFNVPQKRETNNRILVIGNIDANKNQTFVIDSIAEIAKTGKEFTVDIIGGFKDENYKREVMARLEESGVAHLVNFKGWLSQSELLQEWEEADILLLASRHESLPMVIAEAMAAGKVVVASAVGGVPEMFTDRETGFLYPADDVERLCNVLGELHDNSNLLHDVAQKAKIEAYESYHIDSVSKKTLAYYSKILNN
jgi:glycosyltransferase involved in cell wall biosynthesis